MKDSGNHKMKNILDVRDLSVVFHTDDGDVCAVNGLNLSLKKGETLGLVGETGAGKTTLALATLGILAETAEVKGEIFFEGEDLLKKKEEDLLKIRGEKISMIFQDPMTSLNPSLTVVDQIAECYVAHHGLSPKEARKKAVEVLKVVRIPEERADEYPYQFSGGMKQRVVIAMALACNPELLLADEPTTALDVTVQAQVLALMKDLRQNYDMAMIMITHDFGIVAQMCDKVAVMYAGELIESGTLREVFKDTRHPYTKGLFKAIPNLKEESEFLYQIDGLMPDPQNLPKGCCFSPRCKFVCEKCQSLKPKEHLIPGTEHMVRCHRWEEINSLKETGGKADHE